MTKWQKPAFEELEMNAEIGGYQPDESDGGQDPLFIRYLQGGDRAGSRVPYLVAEFLDVGAANEIARRYG